MEFEAAAREHKRVEKIEALLRLRDDLVRDAAACEGVAVTPSHLGAEVVLTPMSHGCWRLPIRFSVGAEHGESMDRRLKAALAAHPATDEDSCGAERQEHLALLSRWYYSSFRDGAWIPVDRAGAFPWRRLVSAVSRIVHESPPAASQ
jgi:hypothetical protein